MWDPAVLWHDGNFLAFMMYSQDGANGLQAGHCIKASSADGAHWRTDAVVIEERERGRNKWAFFKCSSERCGDRFIMDHGSRASEGQDMLRFYESQDLIHWKLLYSSHARPAAGTAAAGDAPLGPHVHPAPGGGNPRPATGGTRVRTQARRSGGRRHDGVARRRRGKCCRRHEVYPAGMRLSKPFGVRRLRTVGRKVYLIGGTGDYLGNKGYAMFTLVADHPRGPFRPDTEAFRPLAAPPAIMSRGSRSGAVATASCW